MSSAPAWVQAIGSILAIIVAALIALYQRRSEVADRKSEQSLAARSLATVVLRDVKELKSRIVYAQERAPNFPNPNIGRGVEPPVIPQALWDNADRMHLVGDRSTEILKAMFQIQEARDLMVGGTLFGSQGDSYYAHLAAAKADCEEAIGGLRDLLAK